MNSKIIFYIIIFATFLTFIISLIFYIIKKQNSIVGFSNNYNKIENLPILNPNNYSEFKEWHDYYEKVYGHKVISIVDLNNFTFFYWFSPLGRIKTQIFLKVEEVEDNMPWIYDNNTDAPENQFKNVGFFVKRQFNVNNLTADYIEVHRTNHSIYEEKGAAWFYNLIGSGFKLSTKNLNIKIVKDRPDFNISEDNPYIIMKNQNINILIYTDFNKLGLIEVVFKLDNEKDIANYAILPLYKGDIILTSHKHEYDEYTLCLK